MKTQNLKRKALVLSMALMAVAALALTQCKKPEMPTEDPTENPIDTVTNMPILPEGETVAITLKVNPDDNEKLDVDPSTGVVTFNANTDEIHVGSGGKYVGTLHYNTTGDDAGKFTGTISGATENQPLYFYFLGNQTATWTPPGDVTTGGQVSISDQSTTYPVIACAPSNEIYTSGAVVKNFTAILRNKCALVKFNTNVISGTVTLSNMFTQAKADFTAGTIAPTETTGNISFTTDAEGVGWAILLPHNGEITATASTTATGYGPVNVTIPTITNNAYLSEGIAVNLFNPLATPLTFEAKEPGATVTFTKGKDVTWTNPVEYSLNGGAWTEYTSGTGITLTNVGDKVSFRGNNATYATGTASTNSSRFNCSEACYVYGNIMSLINKDNFATNTTLVGSYNFTRLFYTNPNLYNHPSKTLVLPATTLTSYCYNQMFVACTSLTTAPALPATTLTSWCYFMMFSGCTSLNSVTCLATDISATNCTNDWLYNVAATGTFTKASTMSSWTTGVNGIPSGWTVLP